MSSRCDWARSGPSRVGRRFGWRGRRFFDGLQPGGRAELPVALVSPDRQLRRTTASIATRGSVEPTTIAIDMAAAADLLDVEAGVVGEYDGADHLHRSRRFRDVGREDTFRRHGLETFTLVKGDLHDRGRAAARMRATRERARFLPEAERQWTVQPARGWPDDHELPLDLDGRLDLRDAMATWYADHPE